MSKSIRQIRFILAFFMGALLLSGLTAIPVEAEPSFLTQFFPIGNPIGDWLDRVYDGLQVTNAHYAFLAYGYDWLVFAHFILAILFIGPYRDPVRNKWVIEFGMIACLLVIPLALIAGQARGIPFWWRMVDCSFGVLGFLPLLACYRSIKKMEVSAGSNISFYNNKTII
jgi:hypothetical protein